MASAIRIHETGGPEVLEWEEVTVADPGPGEVRLRHLAVGLNFIDVYFRTGLYPIEPPFTPGLEACGVVEAVGDGVTDLSVGDRVAYAAPPPGAYSEERLMQADRVVKVPDGIGDEQAAAMMLKGMTAWYLLRRTFCIKAGHTLLYHAAAGGVGLIVGQWAKALGATVIGTASTPEKIKLALAHGYDHVINYREKDFVKEVRELTGGRGCDVVYDSVGKDTFPGSLDCIRPLGMYVLFGQSSGPVPPFDMALLAQKGSLFATRPTLFTYVAERDELENAARELFEVVAGGTVKIEINQTYQLTDAARAHSDLESRKTTGSTVLIP